MHFRVRSELRDGSVLLRLSGELDRAAVPCLLHAVERALARGRGTLVLDAHALRFCDASGAGGPVRARRVAEAVPVTMLLARPRRPLRKLLALCRVTECLPCVP